MININLLAHILLDSEANNRHGLEGNQFKVTLEYLIHFIDTQKPDIELSLIEELKALLKISKTVEDLSFKPQLIKNQIETLPDGHSVLLPGGWVNHVAGHAMLYQFTKLPSGQLRFRIYNSGGGLTFHQQLSTQANETFNPVKTYELAQSFDGIEFEKLIQSLLTSQVLEHPQRIEKHIDEKTLYNNIFSRMQMLDAKEILEPFEPELFTSGQLSGTCSQRVIHQFLKINMRGKTYERLIFQFKMYALDDFIKNSDIQTIIQNKNLLMRAVGHNARVLQDDIKNEIFKPDESFRYEKGLINIKRAIDSIPSLVSTSTSSSETVDIKNPKIEIPRPLINSINNWHWHSSQKAPDFSNASIMEGPKICKKKLKMYIDAMERSDAQALYRLQEINRLILSLPFDFEIILGDLSELLEQIPRFIRLYQKCYQSVYQKNFTAQYLLNMLTLTHIQMQCYNKQPAHEASQKSCYFQSLILQLLTKISTVPFGVSLNSLIDSRLLEIKKYYSQVDDSNWIRLADFYESICKDEQLTALSTLWYPTSTSGLSGSEKSQLQEELSEASSRGFLNLYYLQSQFKKTDKIEYFIIECEQEIQRQSLRNCYVKTKDMRYFWVPAFGDPICFRHNDKNFAYQYRILNDNSPLLDEKYQTLFRSFQEQLDLETSIYLCISVITNLQTNVEVDRSPTSEAVNFRGQLIQKNGLVFKKGYPIPLLQDDIEHSNDYLKNYFDISNKILKKIFSLPRIWSYDFREKSSNHIQILHLENHSNVIDNEVLLTRELQHLRTNLNSCAALSLSYFYEHLEHLNRVDVQNYLTINLFQRPEFIPLEQFDKFIQAGLSYHQDEQSRPTSTSLFLILLKSKVYRYISHPQLIDWTETALNLTDHKDFQSAIHFERFKALMDKKDRTKEQQLKLYESYIWIQSNYRTPHQQFLIETAENDALLLAYEVSDNKPSQEEILKLAKDFFMRYSIDFNHHDISFEDEQFVLSSKDISASKLFFNIHIGRIFTHKGFIGFIPEFLKLHPTFQHLGLNPDGLAIQNQFGDFFELMEEPHTRIHIYEDNKITCQQKIDGKWLTYIPLNKDEQNGGKLYPNIARLQDIPKVLCDANTRLWYHHETQTGYIYRNYQKAFEVLRNGDVRGLNASNPLLHSFESPQLIIGQGDTFHLPRYGFSVKGQNILHSRLQVIDRDKLLPTTTGQLYCKDTKTQEVYCRVPIQLYYAKVATDVGNLPSITHDISGFIQEKDFPRSTYEISYPNSESYFEYLVVNDQLQIDNAQMGLYLCYIYLANYQDDKAWEVLKTVERIGFSGQSKELQFLDWMIHQTPYQFKTKTSTSNPSQHPSQVACQLKALSLYTQFIQQGLEFADSHSDKFQNNINKILMDKIQQYQLRLRHLSKHFHLQDAELLSITRFLSMNVETLDGSICYLHQSLELKLIQNEMRNLEALSKDSAQQVKLDALKLKLQKEILVRKKVTHLKEVHLPRCFNLFGIVYPEESNKNLLSISANTEFAISELGFDMGVIKMKKHFVAYTQIAVNHQHLHYQKLRHFLTCYIRSQHHTPLEKQKDPFLNCCLFLYTLSDPAHQGKFPEVIVNKIDPASLFYSVENISLYIPQNDVIEEIIPALGLIQNELTHDNEKLEVHPLQLPEELDLNTIKNHPEFLCIMQKINDIQNEYQQSLGLSQSEDEAGIALLKQKNQFNNLRVSREEMAALSSKVQVSISNLNKALQAWKTLLEKLNHALFATQSLEMLAELAKPITQDDLIRCYHQNELSGYQLILPKNYTSNEISDMHQEIHYLLHLELNKQIATRLEQAILTNHHLEIIKILSAPPFLSTQPALIVFQFKSNIILRPEQAKTLESLHDSCLSAPQTIQKITMGGGKSKVILPALAQEKANGNRLVVIEVPRALLECNFRDLNETSQSLFQQKAIRFEFNRESLSTAERLENIYHLFHDCMIQRSYIVTTGESIASLELKYLELLSLNQSSESQWNKQIHWIGKTLDLLRTKAEAYIDEAHQALWIKKQLNYTIGKTQMVDETLIVESLKCYTFYQVIEDKKQFSHALLDHAQSPLRSLFTKHHSHRQVILDFLNNESPLENISLTMAEKDILAIYKTQIELMPQTLAKHHREHYGPSKSKSKSKSILERVIAIPYTANEKPSERSEFAQSLETINYTIQSLFLDGLHDELLSYLFEDFIAQARAEIMQEPEKFKHIDDTVIAQSINQLLDGTIRLGQIQLKDPKHIKKLSQKLQHHPAMIRLALKDYILPKIRAEQRILQSDCYQHVDCYHRVQLFSGTPWNAKTYHHRIQYDPKMSFGADGFILQKLIEKNTQIDTHNTNMDINALIDSTPNLHVIIDIGAFFKGINNLSVAKQLKLALQAHPFRYILFYDDSDILCALSTENDNIISIGKTDPKTIRDKLLCEPKDYFTYYDQAHCFGADIAQYEVAQALVLVDEKTPLFAFLQGAMRMRQLSEQQSIKILVPSTLGQKNLIKLFRHFEEQQEYFVADDYLFAAIKQMKNCFRQEAFKKLRQLESPQEQQEYFIERKWQEFFIQDPIQDIYQRYGSIQTLKSKDEFLNDFQKSLISKWQDLTQTEPSLDLIQNLEKIKSHFLEMLPPQLKQSILHVGAEVEIEVEIEVEQDMEMSHEIQMETQTQKIEAFKLKEWDINTLDTVNHYLPHEARIFSSNFKASPNYFNTYQNQSNYLDTFLKPVNSVFMHLSESSELIAVLVSEDDVSSKFKLCLKNQWIVTLDGIVLNSQKPSLSKEQELEYQKLLEQACFFGGHFKKLIQQKEEFLWLAHESSNKLQVYQTHFAAFHERQKSEFIHLTTLLSDKPKANSYLSDHIFEDLSNFNWKQKFRNLSKTDVKEIQSLYERLSSLHSQFFKHDLQVEKQALVKDFPLMAAFINKHFEKLDRMKYIHHQLHQINSQFFLEELGRVNELKEYIDAFQFKHDDPFQYLVDFNKALNHLSNYLEKSPLEVFDALMIRNQIYFFVIEQHLKHPSYIEGVKNIENIESHIQDFNGDDFDAYLKKQRQILEKDSSIPKALKTPLINMAEHSKNLFARGSIKTKAFFMLFIRLQFLIKHHRELENPVMAFCDIVKDYQSIIEQHEGCKKWLGCILEFFKSLIQYFKLDQKFSFFSPQTHTVFQVERFKEVLKNSCS